MSLFKHLLCYLCSLVNKILAYMCDLSLNFHFIQMNVLKYNSYTDDSGKELTWLSQRIHPT